MPTADGAGVARRRRARVATHPLTHLLAAVLLLAVLQGFVVKPFQVPSDSMSPTLVGGAAGGDRILVHRLAYVAAPPERGDVVVFERPPGWGEAPERSALRSALGALGDLTGIGPSNLDALVKRVIGVGGDTVACCGPAGEVLVHGQPIEEPYLGADLPFVAGALDCETAVRSPRCFPPILVPEGQVLVLGDNRAGSSDSVSACRGPGAPDGCGRLVPADALVGEVIAVVLPLDRIAGSPSSGGS